jgi:DMSO/TMAO reductase YedYZ molybdopterin-dependent catalytic subunit
MGPMTAATPFPAAVPNAAPPPRAPLALAGAVATGLALGVSELIAALLPGATSLVAAIGQEVIDRQPVGAKDLVVALFGTNDKLALEVVVVLVALAIGAGTGLLADRRAWAGMAVFAVFGAVGWLAALGTPLADPVLVAIQIIAAVAAGMQALRWGLARAGRTGAHAQGPADGRRSFLLGTAGIGAAALLSGLTGRWLVERGRTAPTTGETVIPSPSEVVPPPLPEADLSAANPGLTPIVIANDAFYRIDTALITPSVDLADWTLRVHGLVDREVTLAYPELVAMPLIEQYVTIACVSNEVGGDLVGNAKWTGVRLRDVLELAGVREGATQLVGRAVDGWTAGMPTAWILDEAREPLIAVRMNDEPLPRDHGFPARLIVPGLYGYVSATKWLSELELTTMEAFDAYWVPLGWAKEAPILTQSRIDTPRGSVPAGRHAIAGVAWAPDRGISRVEVQVDGGTWRDADLSSPISEATWVQWVLRTELPVGRHELRVRATDGYGTLQEERSTRPAPDGARGWHTVRIEAA